MDKASGGRDEQRLEGLLRELYELRDLDRRRHARPRGPRDDRAAVDDLDKKARELMDRFRELSN